MTPYSRGNKFSPFISVADAAVDWAGLMPKEYHLIFINAKGLPTHLDSRELLKRAEGLLTHIDAKIIEGYTHNEYGRLLPVTQIRLERTSYKQWANMNIVI